MRSLKHLNKYFWKYKWRFFFGILFAIASSVLLNVYVPILVGNATNFIKMAVDEKYPLPVILAELFRSGMLIIGVTLVGGFIMFLMRQAIIVMSRHIEFDLKNEIFEHYQKLDMAFYRRNNTGDLMNRISEDVSRVRMYIGPAVMYFASTLSTLVLIPPAMSAASLKLTVYVLLPLPVLVVAIYFVSDLINKMSNQVQAQLSKLSTIAQESFSGVRVLKAYVQEEPTGDYFSRESGMYRKRYLRLIGTEALFNPFIFLLMGISTQLVIYVGGMQYLEGKIKIGDIVTFIMYVGKLTWPVASLGWVTSLVQRAAASQDRINEFLHSQPSVVNPVHAKREHPPLQGAIEFRNVSFSYPDSGIQALKGLSFTLGTGQSLAIIGKTGSGKSSVAALICRLYDAVDGEILIDGKNIKEWDLSGLRKQIGYVPQDTFLFSDTVENNIAFGSVSKDPESILEAARNAGIYNEIQRFPDKFATLIGERGITLSGGQKQRIAIARAILNSPRILIFDDCLSAVDTETEAEILGNLNRVMRGKTTLLISHRVSTVKQAGYTLVLDNGQVVEQGTHAELMSRKGFYYELYQMQLMEEQNAANA